VGFNSPLPSRPVATCADATNAHGDILRLVPPLARVNASRAREGNSAPSSLRRNARRQSPIRTNDATR